jgi:hypothetical protein
LIEGDDLTGFFLDARRLIEAWRIGYNESQPQMALGNIPPGEDAFTGKNFDGANGLKCRRKLKLELDHQSQVLQASSQRTLQVGHSMKAGHRSFEWG